MIDDHHRRARMCGEHVQLCAGHGGTIRWSTALDPALEVASGRPGAGGAVARWSQNVRVPGQFFFSVFGTRREGGQRIVPMLRRS